MKSVPLQTKNLEDYRALIGDDAIEALNEAAEPLKGRQILHINSTSYGGGVAEILASLVPLTRSLGIDAHWQVIDGNDEFFRVTKSIHNGMHGGDVQITAPMRAAYREVNRRNAEEVEDGWDFVVVHDPQPLALARDAKRSGHWAWRCHVNPTRAVPGCRELIGEFLPEYEASIFSLEEYAREGWSPLQPFIIPPSIDPLSAKNRPMSLEEAEAVAARFGVDPSRPTISTVSRFDPWKDPLGLIDVYRRIKRDFPDLQLLFVASMADDDPEGWEYYERTLRKAGEDPDIYFLTNLRGVNAEEVNAFQRLSHVGLLRSIREGFGLSVSESLWKGVPVIGSQTGGIPLQVLDGQTGFLVTELDETVERVTRLLEDEALRSQMGEAGRQHVLENFLITRHLMDYLRLFNHLDAST
ncbi:MAG: glycosyltransferase [Thermoplasmata archaeon]